MRIELHGLLAKSDPRYLVNVCAIDSVDGDRRAMLDTSILMLPKRHLGDRFVVDAEGAVFLEQAIGVVPTYRGIPFEVQV